MDKSDVIVIKNKDKEFKEISFNKSQVVVDFVGLLKGKKIKAEYISLV